MVIVMQRCRPTSGLLGCRLPKLHFVDCAYSESGDGEVPYNKVCLLGVGYFEALMTIASMKDNVWKLSTEYPFNKLHIECEDLQYAGVVL